MTNLIVDASIAVKWVIDQDNSELARSLVTSKVRLIAPSLLLAEAGNALWKYVQHDQISVNRALADMKTVQAAIHKLVPMHKLHMEALQLAAVLNHPIYDCFYLALARQKTAPLVTADKRLLKLADKLPDLKLHRLGEKPAP